MEGGAGRGWVLTDPADVGREVTRKTLAGARWILILNVATAPLSFLTNTVLGQISPLALGYLGAVLLFSGVFQTVFVLGGPRVFTRIVPSLPKPKRFPFFVTYTLLALGISAAVALVLTLAAPGVVAAILERFGSPSPRIAATFGLEVLLGIFLGHFLWSTLAGPGAAVVTRLPVVLFFVSAMLALGPLRARITSDPAHYLWHTAIAVYGVTLLLSAWFVARTEERRRSGPLRLGLPQGFWPAAGYTQIESVIVFAYLAIAPTFVLLWLDVAALAPFYAALRYVALFDASAAMLTALLAPSLATLDASGLREDAVRQARAALRGAMLFLLPATLALIFFAVPLMEVFNAAFRPHATLLRIVAVGVLLSPVVHFGSGMLVAFGAYRAYLAASLLYVAAAVGLLFVLVPAFGLAGAAWCAMLTTLMNAAVVTGALWLRAGVRIPLRVFVAVCVAAVAALTAWWIDPGWMLGAALTAGFTAVFALVASVTWDEAYRWVHRLARHG